MPAEYDSKPCTIEGCHGTMLFNKQVVRPGENASFVREGGLPQLATLQPGWLCDEDPEHVEWAE